MKKSILLLALLTLAMLCNTCVGTQPDLLSQSIVEGYATPGDPRTSYELIVQDISYKKCDSMCNAACKRDGLSTVGMTVRFDHIGLEARAGRCFCENIRRDLSRVANVGITNTENECSVMAWNAGYLEYFYNSMTRSCGGDRTYENLGTAETKADCIAMWKEHGGYIFAYKSDTKRCYAIAW